jgi:hypothetical protein
MALAFASLISSLSISPALAAINDVRGQGALHIQGNQHIQGNRHGNHGQRATIRYRPEYRQPYIYAQPVYVPPPMYYEPEPSPGITLFFPLEIRL